ncbi:MAG: hypothetical protein AAFY31_07610 [Pseudomonadota bacterium]
MAVRLACCITFFVALGAAAEADPSSPLSAIDWLSDSVTSDDPPAQQGGAELKASAPGVIRVLPLDQPVPDSAGLRSADELGVPFDIWGRSAAGDLAEGLARISVGQETPPSVITFLTELPKLRLAPPIDAAVDDRFFLARVDRLLEKGHLAEAEALLDAAGLEDAQAFRRRFDIALLTGTETEACRQIEETPDLSPTYPARIFCLARLGQFDVAALTLGNAETLGILTEREDALLLHFLDPELFEGDPIPAAPRVPTPLQFRLYEAVGNRISTEALPLPFAHADLSTTVGWKARLNAAERLASSGAITFEQLLAVYQERGPSASGGVWERIRAVSALSDAIAKGEPDQIATALPAAWASARQVGYGSALASWVLPSLSTLSKPGRASHVALEIALTAGDTDVASRFARSALDDQFLLSIANGQFGTVTPRDALGRAVLRGLSAASAGPSYESLIADDRRGEVLLRALGQLADGASGNPSLTAQSLAALNRLGLTILARQIAIELILKEGAA